MVSYGSLIIMRSVAKARKENPNPILTAQEPLGWLIAYSLVGFVFTSKRTDEEAGSFVELESGIALLPGLGLPKWFPLPLSPKKGTSVATTDQEDEISHKAKSLDIRKVYGAHPLFFSASRYSVGRGGYAYSEPLSGLEKRVFSSEDLYSLPSPGKYEHEFSSGVSGEEIMYDVSPAYLSYLVVDNEEAKEVFSEKFFPGKGKLWINKIHSLVNGEARWVFSVSATGEQIHQKKYLLKRLLKEEHGLPYDETWDAVSLVSGSLARNRYDYYPQTTGESLLLSRDGAGNFFMTLYSYGKEFLFLLGKEHEFIVFFPSDPDKNRNRERFSRAVSGLEKADLVREFKRFARAVEDFGEDAHSLLLGIAFPVRGIVARTLLGSSSPLFRAPGGLLAGTLAFRTLAVLPDGWKVEASFGAEEEPLFENRLGDKSLPLLRREDDGKLGIVHLNWKEPLDTKWNSPQEILRVLRKLPNSKQKTAMSALLLLEDSVCISGRRLSLVRANPQMLEEIVKAFYRESVPLLPELKASMEGARVFLRHIERPSSVSYDTGDPFLIAELGGLRYRFVGKEGEEISLPGDRIYLVLVPGRQDTFWG